MSKHGAVDHACPAEGTVRGRDTCSKLSRANCLADSLYKSNSNWHKSQIHCSTSRTNSHSEGGERTFYLENYTNPKTAEVKKNEDLLSTHETVTTCLAGNNALKYSLSATQRPNPEHKCIVQPLVTASDKVVGNEPVLLPLICFSVLCYLLEEPDFTLPKVSHLSNR